MKLVLSVPCWVGGLLLGLSGWACAQTAPSAPVPADADLASFKPPPRDVKDILRVLEASKIDLVEIDRARKIVELTPPEGADTKALNRFYHRRSLAQQKLGRIQEALADMRKAAIDHRLAGTAFELRDLVDLGVLEGFAGNLQESSQALERAKVMAQNTRQGGMVLTVNRLLVGNYAVMGDLERARRLLLDTDSQLVLLRTSPRALELMPYWEASLESTRGVFFWQQGQWVESERSLRKALRLLRQQYESAKAHPQKVDDLADAERTVNDGTRVVRHFVTQIIYRQLNLSDTLLQQRKLVDAEHFARESLTMGLDHFGRNSTEVGRSLAQLSRVIAEQGRFAEAVLLAKASMAAQAESGISPDSRIMAASRKFYATALVADGQHQAADQVFNEMLQSVRKNPHLEKTFRVDDLDWVLAMQRLGKQQEAQAMSERIWTQAEKRLGKQSPRAAMTAAFHAVSLHLAGQSNQAHDLFAQAVPVLMDQAKNDAENDTASYKQQQRTTYLYENYLGVLAQAARQDPAKAPQAAEEAFRVADLAKSSGVQRALTASAARANIRDPQLAALARKEQDLQRRVNGLSELLTGLLAAPPEQQLPAVQARIRQDIEAFKTERDGLKKEIEKRFPDYADMVEPKPATVARTRAFLRPGEVLVAWYFGESQSYVWAIAKEGPLSFQALPLSRKDMAAQVAQLRRALDPGVPSVDQIPAFDVASSHRLYQQILAPVASALDGKKVLLVVPHAELGQLPLSVLVTQTPGPSARGPVLFDQYRQTPWLIRQAAIAQLPSVTTFIALRNTPAPQGQRKNFVGFGDPFFSLAQAKQAERQVASAPATALATRGVPLQLRSVPKTAGVSSAELALLPRLPDTQEELREIAKVLDADPSDVFLNRNATVQAVMQTDLSDRKVVMFSTHGLVPGELDGLTQPALAMTSPEVTGHQDDGLLTMDKVLGLKLNADWVVLSACNTAAGEGSGSEAVSGLGRAFFFAGARALLVSNWPVDSVAARELMTDLFRRQKNQPQLSKPEALRAAMVQQLDQGQMVQKGAVQYSYAHPLFWAPFVVVGE